MQAIVNVSQSALENSVPFFSLRGPYDKKDDWKNLFVIYRLYACADCGKSSKISTLFSSVLN